MISREPQQLVSRLRLRIWLLLALRAALLGTAGWCFVWGVASLVGRAAFDLPRGAMLWGAAGLGFILIWAMVLAARRVPGQSALRALIDRTSRAGGLLMAEEEAEIGDWRLQLAVERPVMRWRAGRRWAMLGLSLAFLMVTFALPQQLMALREPAPLDIGDDVAQLTEQIETLEQEQIIAEEQAEQWREQIDQARREASGWEPMKTWQTLDEMRNRVSEMAQRAAEQSLAAADEQASMSTMAKTLPQAGNLMKNDELNKAMAELARMAGEATKNDELFKEAISDELAAKLAAAAQQMGGEGQSLDAQSLQQLAQALAAAQQGRLGRIGQLVEARLIDGEMMRMIEGMDGAEVEAILARLAECAGEGEPCNAARLWAMIQGQGPGRGGINRGRGDAPMAWGDPSSREGASFEEQALPPASLEALRQAQLVGVSRGDPDTTDSAEAAVPGALIGAQAGGGSAHRQQILPRHHRAVEQYFERESPSQ
jgi:hypothetical protein